jgi:hypothetical protein
MAEEFSRDVDCPTSPRSSPASSRLGTVGGTCDPAAQAAASIAKTTPASLGPRGVGHHVPDRGQATSPLCPRRDAGTFRYVGGIGAITRRIAARRRPRAHVATPDVPCGERGATCRIAARRPPSAKCPRAHVATPDLLATATRTSPTVATRTKLGRVGGMAAGCRQPVGQRPIAATCSRLDRAVESEASRNQGALGWRSEAMRSYLKTFVIGGVLSLPFLGLGAGVIVIGVDATVHQWAGGGGSRHHHSRPSTKMHDTSRMYGPGVILAGVSLCVGGLLVIPSALIRDHGRGRRFWPKVALLWKLVGVGTAVGFGMSILASCISILWRG